MIWNAPIVFAAIYITYWVTMSVAHIGDTYEGGTHEWYLPILMLVVLLIPYLLGYLGGKEQ